MGPINEETAADVAGKPGKAKAGKTKPAAKPAKTAAAKGNGKKAAAKPAAKAKPEKPAAKPAAATEPQPDPIVALIAEFHSSDTRDDDFLRALLQKAFDAGKAGKRARGPRREGPTKRELAADLLRRPEGCTAREILDVTGWPAVSVPAVAKASGLTLTQKKDGRVTTYFGK